MNLRTAVVWLSGLFCSVSIWSEPLLAQAKKPNPPNPQQHKIQQEQGQVKAAEHSLSTANAGVKEAHAKFKQADAHHDRLVHENKNLKEELESHHGSKLGLKSALQAQDDAKKSFEAASGPILTSLKTKAEYQAALRDAEAAKVRLRTLREEKLLDSKRTEIARDITNRMKHPDDLEQSAIAADPKAKSAKASFDQARSQVQTLNAKVKEAIENDPKMKDHIKKLHQSKEAMAQAKAQIEAKEKAVAAQHANLNKQRGDLAHAKNQAQPKKPAQKKK